MKSLFWIGTIRLSGRLGVIATSAISNSDPRRGAEIGVMNGIFLSPLMMIITQPPGLLG